MYRLQGSRKRFCLRRGEWPNNKKIDILCEFTKFSVYKFSILGGLSSDGPGYVVHDPSRKYTKYSYIYSLKGEASYSGYIEYNGVKNIFGYFYLFMFANGKIQRRKIRN